MISHSVAPPQLNANRYWGEEKNIDSIDSVYIKKMCYSYNNDVSLYASSDDRAPGGKSSRDSKQKNLLSSAEKTITNHSTSTNDLARLALHDQYRQISIENNRHKKEDSSRSRKNFSQKLRRQSCSVDKYSCERAHKVASSTMTITTRSNKSIGKAMRYGLSSSTSKK